MLIYWTLPSCVLVGWIVKLSFLIPLKRQEPELCRYDCGFVIIFLVFSRLVSFMVNNIYQFREFCAGFWNWFIDPLKKNDRPPWRKFWGAGSVHWRLQRSTAKGGLCWGWHVSSSKRCYRGISPLLFLCPQVCRCACEFSAQQKFLFNRWTMKISMKASFRCKLKRSQVWTTMLKS